MSPTAEWKRVFGPCTGVETNASRRAPWSLKRWYHPLVIILLFPFSDPLSWPLLKHFCRLGGPAEPDPVEQKLSLEHEDVNMAGASEAKAPAGDAAMPSAPPPETEDKPKPAAEQPAASPALAPAPASTDKPEAANGVDLSETLADPAVPVEEKHKAEESVEPAVLEKLAKEVSGTEKPAENGVAGSEVPKPALESPKGPAADAADPAVEEAAKGPASPTDSASKKRKSGPASPREGVRRSSRLKSE